MSRLRRYRRFATSRQVVVRFFLLVALPVVLAVNSFIPFLPAPAALYPFVEGAFRVAVYYPVALVRTVVAEPIGLRGLFYTPIVEYVAIFGSLAAFYYVLGAALVAAQRRLGRTIAEYRRDGRDRR